MAENVPPASNTGGTAANTGMDQTQNRGIPYYEKLRRDLRDALQKKRLMDKSMVS
jgi:chromatin modification-related protein EAF6